MVIKKNNSSSAGGIRVNTPSTFIKKGRLNTGIYTGNKYDILNNSPNLGKKNFKLKVNQSCGKNILKKLIIIIVYTLINYLI